MIFKRSETKLKNMAFTARTPKQIEIASTIKLLKAGFSDNTLHEIINKCVESKLNRIDPPRSFRFIDDLMHYSDEFPATKERLTEILKEL